MRLLAMLVLFALSGCDAARTQGPNLDLDDLPATLSLRVGEQRQIGSSIVRFAEVASDSRCPQDVVCVSAGNAKVAIVVGPAAGEGPAYRLELNSTVEPKRGSALGLSIGLLRLLPEPISTRPTRDYRVELRVEPAVE